VPLEAVVQWLLAAGYQGVFDLELNGPAIDALGTEAAVTQAVTWLDALLKELGAGSCERT
jgi:hypothetical protein